MKHTLVYAVGTPFVQIGPEAVALFFPIDYEFMEEKAEAAQQAVRDILKEEFGEGVQIHTHEVNLGYAADWHAVLAFIGLTLIPAIPAYVELGKILRRLFGRIKDRGGVVLLPLITLQIFLALTVDDAVSERGADRSTLSVNGSSDFPELRELEGKQVDYAEHVFLATLSDSNRIYQYAGCSQRPYIRLIAMFQRAAALQMGWRTPLAEQIIRDEPKEETPPG